MILAPLGYRLAFISPGQRNRTLQDSSTAKSIAISRSLLVGAPSPWAAFMDAKYSLTSSWWSLIHALLSFASATSDGFHLTNRFASESGALCD